MLPTCPRFDARRVTFVALGGLVLACAWAALPALGRAWAAQDDPPPRMTLLGTLAEWQYPDSKLLGGANMSDGGDPSVADVKCRAILTTPDPAEKVIEYYEKKFDVVAEPTGPDAAADGKKADPKAVYTQDDSKGRPLTLRLIVVTNAETTTTLVISRAKDEPETHIAWSHYRRFKH